MDSNNILSLLGLALRGGRLVMGEEPVEAVARARDARVLLLASDAADNTRRRVEHFAEAGACLWLRVPFTKAEMGRQFGRTSVAVAAVTDVGLASAVVNKLAQLDPQTYGDAAERQVGLGVGVVFGLAEMGADDQRGAVVQQVLDRGQSGADALVVGDLVGRLVQRHVEVHAQQHFLAGKAHVADALLFVIHIFDLLIIVFYF